MSALYSVVDVKEGRGNVVLRDAEREEVQEFLSITKSTFYNCLANDERLCKRRYSIVRQLNPDNRYAEHFEKDFILDFSKRWKEMQKIWGVESEE